MTRLWSSPGAGYPSKPRLSPSEELSVLRVGPKLEWFAPFVVLGEVRTAQPMQMPYGLVHWYLDAEGKPKTDVQTFYSVEDARWAADWLHSGHEDSCRCIAVFYWTPETVNRGPEDRS